MFSRRVLRDVLVGLGSLLIVVFGGYVVSEPVRINQQIYRKFYGVDIMLVLDISTSMLAEDIRPNRLKGAQQEALQFVEGRPRDRIGLVIFAGEAVTLVPLTTDHRPLRYWLGRLTPEMLPDGTAIGLGLATALARLQNSTAVSKVVVLLTDGENNTGFVRPEEAIPVAQELGVRIYTIGVGTIGKAPYPVQTPMGKQYQMMEVHLNEPLLKRLAAETGGKYFRSTDRRALHRIFQEIDRMEKSRLEEQVLRSEVHSPDRFFWGLLLGLVLVLMGRLSVFPVA